MAKCRGCGTELVKSADYGWIRGRWWTAIEARQKILDHQERIRHYENEIVKAGPSISHRVLTETDQLLARHHLEIRKLESYLAGLKE